MIPVTLSWCIPITAGGNDGRSSPLAALRNGYLGGDHTSPSLSWVPTISGCSWKRHSWHRVSPRAGSWWCGDTEWTPVLWKELPYEGYLLEIGRGRVEGRRKPRGWLSSREWIHSSITGKMQRFCPTTAPEHSEEQCTAGSLSLQWDIMENARAGRKEGKQVNYTRKLGQSSSRDIIE